ncbi:MAG: hypothetical protein AAGD06_26395 [Acidobacteriota bacterium]
MIKASFFKTSFALVLFAMTLIGGTASIAQARISAVSSCPTRACPNVCGDINQTCTRTEGGVVKQCRVAIHLLADPQPGGDTDFCYHSCN